EKIGTIAMAATAGKVALTKTTTLLTVDNPVGNSSVVDFIGYGTADAFEGSGAAPAPSNTTSDLRAGGGATDNNNNATDFSTGTPNPRN
ncbi:MAG: lamin tail domain-containing protein, partial [Limisphaerales bacterium]